MKSDLDAIRAAADDHESFDAHTLPDWAELLLNLNALGWELRPSLKGIQRYEVEDELTEFLIPKANGDWVAYEDVLGDESV